MTDELSPEQEAVVRRLLAQSRHEDPIPDDVAARLDDVLGRLVSDEGVDDLEVFEDGPAPVTPVTPLAGVRQRRRTAGRLLLAAAAIVVGGVTVGQVVGNSSFDADSSDAGTDTAADAPRDETANESAGDAGGDAGGNAESGDGGGRSPAEVPEPTDGSVAANDQPLDLLESPLSLSSASFAADVQRQLGRDAAARRRAANADYDGVVAYLARDQAFECAPGSYGAGARLPAYYDAEEAVLVLRRPRAGVQRVELLTCGTAVELNSVDLPAR